jgi:hypothetical protein
MMKFTTVYCLKRLISLCLEECYKFYHSKVNIGNMWLLLKGCKLSPTINVKKEHVIVCMYSNTAHPNDAAAVTEVSMFNITNIIYS